MSTASIPRAPEVNGYPIHTHVGEWCPLCLQEGVRLAAEPPALDVNRSKACPLDLDCYRFQGHAGEHMYARLAREGSDD